MVHLLRQQGILGFVVALLDIVARAKTFPCCVTQLMKSVAKIYDTSALRNYGVDVDATAAEPMFRVLRHPC